MSKVVDLIQYGLLLGSIVALFKISWQLAVILFALDLIIGVARLHWSKS